MHDILPFSKYTNERLPPRVRNILESVYQAAWRVLEPVLQRSLADYEQALFKRADKARNHQEQNDLLIAMREVRKRSTEIQVAIRDCLQERLVRLVTSVASPARSTAESKSVLQLVDSEDLEESLILSEFSAKAEMRYAAAWHVLSYRFAVIAGTPPLEVELLPLGPHALADALRSAGRRLELAIAAKVDCYRFLELQLLNALEAMLKAVNDDLIEHRVLAHIHIPRSRSAAAPAAAPDEAATDVDKRESESRHGSEPQPPVPDPEARGAAAARASAPTGAAQPTQFPRQAGTDPVPLAGAFAPMHGAPSQPPVAAPPMPAMPAPYAGQSSAPPPPAAPGSLPGTAGPALQALDQLWSGGVGQNGEHVGAAMSTPAHEEDQTELFTTLRELLSGRRTQRGDRRADSGGRARSVAPPADVQGVLSVLQGQPVTPRMVEGRWQPRRVVDIKQDMLSQLRALGDGTPTRLSDEDEDTVDLVGLLFDQLGDGLQPGSLSNNLLTKLQVPVLKVALRDKAFFTKRKHPARLLLNEVAEAAALWVEDEETDKPVLDKMQLVVDRVLRDYDQDDQLFDDMLGDLGSHLSSVRRKADIAEKRQIDAARGREKMDLSRAAAVEAIESLLKDREVPDALRSFLLEAWTDVLALSLLRQGPQGEDFRHELDLAAALLELANRSGSVSERKARFEAVAEQVRDGVAAVGMTPEAFQKVRSALVGALALDEPDEPKPRPEVLQETLKARPRLGGDQGSDKPSTILSHLRGTEHWNLSPEELAMCERIKQLPFGTWFDFTRNQQGDRIRRKLSWFSPVTGRCLFVNARGAKVEDRTISALARDLVRGTARVVVEHRERLIDRAWKAIMAAFKSAPEDKDDALVEPGAVA